MLRVGVLGAGGRMGQEVCRSVQAAHDLELVAAVDPHAAGSAVGSDSPLTIAADPHELERRGAEVAVDFTQPDAVKDNIVFCAEHKIHVVVGTTGLTDQALEEVARVLDKHQTNAVVAPNFAIGAVLLMRLADMAAPYMDSVEIIEAHHAHKRDAPSGTALSTAQRLEASRRRAGSPPWSEDPTTVETLKGARGAATEEGIHIHALRLPGLVAHQEVVFGAQGQTLSLRHDTIDRTSFMPGVLLAVGQVPSRPGLTVGLDPLLGL